MPTRIPQGTASASNPYLALNGPIPGRSSSQLRDSILIVGMILAPMTGLRYGKIGPAEILIATWCILEWNTRQVSKPRQLAIGFWMLFLAIVSAGTIIGYNLHQGQSQPSQLTTWIYLAFVSISLYQWLHERSLAAVESILHGAALFGIVWYGALYAYSRTVESTLFGAPLWFGGDDPALGSRFTGGGTNPHQLALFVAIAIFSLLRDVLRTRSQVYRSADLLAIFVAVFLGIMTASSTLVVSVLLTLAAAMIFGILWTLRTFQGKLIATFALAVILLLSARRLWQWAEDFVAADPNGEERLVIWATAGDTIAKSPIVGLGPGTHAGYGTIEYHSNYLEIMAMSGTLGIALFLAFHVFVLRISAREPTLFLIVIALMAYGISGFSARRLPYWIAIMIVVVIAEKSADSQLHKHHDEKHLPSRRTSRKAY